jgi:ATP-dependent RNA helicase DeaD
MLKMGFITDIEFVIDCLVHEHQTLLFAATMPSQIKHLAKKYLKNPVTIELNIDQVAPQSLCHHFRQVKGLEKFPTLLKYIRDTKPAQAIIFCNSRRNCINLYDRLKDEIDSVDFLHGGIEQSKRTSIFRQFKKKQIQTIVATDIASRGLDFSHVTDVINYDFPLNPQAYTHTLKEVIETNNIKPVWLNAEPQLDKIKRPRNTYRKFHAGRSNTSRRRS